jgi:hypothetical protein
MNFESLVRHKALSLSYNTFNTAILDHVISQSGESETLGLKKVQFMVSPVVHDDLRSLCAYLGMSQREFLQALLLDALPKAWALIEQEGASPEALGYITEA